MKLWQKVTLGLILGVIAGIYLGEKVEYVKPIGNLFLKAIKMIISPVIFFSLVAGLTSTHDPSSLGRVGLKAAGVFLVTTCFAVTFGLLVAIIMQPGVGVNISFDTLEVKREVTAFNFQTFCEGLIPENFVKPFIEGNTLQVVFLALFTGVTINKMGSSANQLKNFIHLASKLVFRMISIIIQFSPYGSFALTAWIVGTQGIDILYNLSKLVIAVVVAMGLQYIIFGILILVFCKLSPIPFYKKSFEYQMLAFSTSSSKATLPTTMQVCRNSLGVSETSTSFILPLGAAINMDGLAINLGLSAVFFAQVFGVPLTLYDYILIIVTGTLGSIGGAGIPGASLFMLPMVLSAVNLPIDGVAILAGIDRILDMLRTTINITGDATVTMIIDCSEGNFDKEKYYSSK